MRTKKLPFAESKKAIPNMLEMNVPGRKIMVRAAIVRIDELSSLVFMAISVLV